MLRFFSTLLMLDTQKGLRITLDRYPYYAPLCLRKNVTFSYYIEALATPQCNHPSIAQARLLGNEFSSTPLTRQDVAQED